MQWDENNLIMSLKLFSNAIGSGGNKVQRKIEFDTTIHLSYSDGIVSEKSMSFDQLKMKSRTQSFCIQIVHYLSSNWEKTESRGCSTFTAVKVSIITFYVRSVGSSSS
jgi:hypothetical protein